MSEERPRPADRSIAVIGGGWAGCACAFTLTALGHRVVLFEVASTLGGRARRVVRDGLSLDNGAHLMLGAYRETLGLLGKLHDPASFGRLLRRRPLELIAASQQQAGGVTLRARAWPAPFGLLAALATARGLSLGDRAKALAWFMRLKRAGFRCAPDQTASELLASSPAEAARRLWRPLCLAALNTPPERACAQVFANVLALAFDRAEQDCDLVLAATDLSTLLPDAVASRVTGSGGVVETRNPAVVTRIDDKSVTVRHRRGIGTFAGAVVAVGPHQLDRAFVPGLAAAHRPLADTLARARMFDYEPIVTVWLGYRSRVELAAPMLRLDDAPGQWAFERSDVLASGQGPASTGLAQVIAVVLSAHGPHDRLEAGTIAGKVDSQLRRLWPELSACAWHQVIRERRATHACTPRRPRWTSAEIHPRLFLAGDYLDADLPATLESAVRSGIAAARGLAERTGIARERGGLPSINEELAARR